MFTQAIRAAVAVGLITFFTNASADPAEVALEDEASEEEAPESAVSSPPMEMDDPGTPGSRGLELNIVGSFDRIGDGRGAESLLDANYGIGDRIQLKYERPYVSEGTVGGESQSGLGATELGVKWRFIDHGGLEVAVYPNYSFDDGFTLMDEEGNPELSSGHSYYLPLLISKVFGRVYSAAANIGYRRNLENRGDDVNLALGLGRAIGGSSRVLAEVFSERDEHLTNRQTDIRAGYVVLLFPQWFEKSSFEVPLYGSLGHSIGQTEEGESALSFAFGFSFIVKPRH